MIPSYTDIQHVAHKVIEEIWSEPVEIQEKIDGSQISFMLDDNGSLLLRSKGQQLHEGAPDSKMFEQAISSVRERVDLLVPGHVWRGEYLRVPKHNTLNYGRIPRGHIAIFDIELSLGDFAETEQRTEMATFLGYETVPTFYKGVWDKDLSDLKNFLEFDSFLGGQKIEGVVVKCYSKFYNGKPMMGKLVSEEFKEKHTTAWKQGNPGKKDVIENLITIYRVEARWRKAVQHVRERGELTNSPKDIGPLLKEISLDILKEEEDAIKEELFKLAWPQISRGVARGFPDWYKDYLLELDKEFLDPSSGETP